MKTYRGNCHCGRFVFEVTLPAPITEGGRCNCSICSKKGYVVVEVPDDGKFEMVKGREEDLTSYGWNNILFHKFCSTCGSTVFLDPPSTAVDPTSPGSTKHKFVNLRCIQGPLDLWTLKTYLFDGKAIPPAYVEPDFSGPDPPVDPAAPGPTKVYHGSCHCGAVRVAVRFKDLTTLDPNEKDDRVIDCNCSVCIRGGYVWIYPKAAQVAFEGEDNITYYSFAKHVNRKAFCRICGVHLANAFNPLTPEQLAALPPLARAPDAMAWRARVADRCSINTRALHGVDVDALPIQKLDGYAIVNPQFVNP